MKAAHAVLAIAALCIPGVASCESADPVSWPPRLRGATNGTVTLRSNLFLKVPQDVAAARSEEGVVPFVMAEVAPTVELAFHDRLGPNPAARRLWSSWGDICLASDGSVYAGIGDHHHDSDGDGRCFIYRWDPNRKTLTQVVDMNKVVLPQPGQPAWTKVHAKIDEGSDGRIYFCCTLNAGSRAGDANFQWTERLPGAQLYQYDPQTGQTKVYSDLPPRRCTATSRYDAVRDTWWCHLEAGNGDALYGLQLKSREVVYQSMDGVVGFNRNFALTRDGRVYFNGADGRVMRLRPEQRELGVTDVRFSESPGMRASTRESTTGDIYGVAHKSHQLFRFRPAAGELEMLGPTWNTGEYTTVMILSPDERFLYYLPGAHGKAFRYGTPVVQYEIATRTRKVLAFLAPAVEELVDYVPGGTYGIKLSPDGGTLYINFNGHAADEIRPDHMKPIGFGLCSFAAIQIPESER